MYQTDINKNYSTLIPFTNKSNQKQNIILENMDNTNNNLYVLTTFFHQSKYYILMQIFILIDNK